jgi:Tfp pilus assembly PilM family ATPase
MFVLEAEDYAFDGSDFGSWVERTMGSKLPAAQGRAAVDWQALGGCAAEGRVLAVGVDAQRVNARVQLLKMADLEATILDARALALTNALLWNHPEAREGCVGLIEVGGNSAAILILDDGIPVLAQSFDMPPLPRHPPYGLSSEEMWAHSIELLRSFEQCLSLDRARIPVDGVETPQVGQIFVAGGGFLIPGLLETLAEVMQWVVRRAHPFERIPVAPGGSGQIAMEDEHLMFMQAMGLALRRS